MPTTVTRFVQTHQLEQLITANDGVAVVGVFRTSDAKLTRSGTRSQSLVATLELVLPLSSRLPPSVEIDQFWGGAGIAPSTLCVAVLSPGARGPHSWTLLGIAQVSSEDEGKDLAFALLNWQQATFRR